MYVYMLTSLCMTTARFPFIYVALHIYSTTRGITLYTYLHTYIFGYIPVFTVLFVCLGPNEFPFWAIIVIVVGGVLLLLACIIIIIAICCACKKSDTYDLG